MLHEFITVNRDEIISRCRAKVAARSAASLTSTENDRGIPLLVDQLREVLRRGLTTNREVSRSAIEHGHDLLRQGFTVSQVMHRYADVCQAITELAGDLGAPISTDDCRTLNRCLDDAIAGAVTEYGRERHQAGIDGESARGSERLGFFAHELRNLMNTSLMAFEVLKTGNVGVVGRTGAVLHRSLLASHALITRSLAEVRLTQGVQNPEQFAVAAFIDEIASASSLEAKGRGIGLTVSPVEAGAEICADRQVLAAAVGNLLQNAFKFTRPRTTVTLSVDASPERVQIEVRDECGGLACADVNELFRPFAQRSADRTGVGLGLAFSRWAAEANDGRIYARSLPGEGCIFTLDLPRCPARVSEVVHA